MLRGEVVEYKCIGCGRVFSVLLLDGAILYVLPPHDAVSASFSGSK